MARVIAALIVLVVLLFGPASAQTYPSRTITIIVPADAGGILDLLARNLSRHLREKWGQSVIVENVPGAAAQLGTARVARSNPDGYTLLVAADAVMVINPFVFSKISYAVSDFAPISGFVTIDTTLLARSALPVRSVAEMITLAKLRPGELTFGTFGAGSNSHLFILSLADMAKVSFNVVHYRGVTPSLADVVAGHIDLTFANANSARGPVEKGVVKMLATTGEERLSLFPEVPTIRETIPGYKAQGWFGLWAPAGTPDDILHALSKEVQVFVASPEFQTKFVVPNAWRSIANSPEGFRKFIEAEAERWGALVRTVNLRM